jgi:hypothetical protein
LSFLCHYSLACSCEEFVCKLMTIPSHLNHFERPLVRCPSFPLWHGSEVYFAHPSVVVTFGIEFLLCLVFSLLIAINYNAVKVFNKKASAHLHTVIPWHHLRCTHATTY